MRGIAFKNKEKEGLLNWSHRALELPLRRGIEGKIEGRREVTERRGTKCKQLLFDLKERRGYCKLKYETPDRTVRKSRFGRRFGPVVRQMTK